MGKARHLLLLRHHQACGLTMTFSTTLPSPPTPPPTPLAALPITLTINPNLPVTSSVTTSFYSPNIANGVGKTSRNPSHPLASATTFLPLPSGPLHLLFHLSASLSERSVISLLRGTNANTKPDVEPCGRSTRTSSAVCCPSRFPLNPERSPS